MSVRELCWLPSSNELEIGIRGIVGIDVVRLSHAILLPNPKIAAESAAHPLGGNYGIEEARLPFPALPEARAAVQGPGLKRER